MSSLSSPHWQPRALASPLAVTLLWSAIAAVPAPSARKRLAGTIVPAASSDAGDSSDHDSDERDGHHD